MLRKPSTMIEANPCFENPIRQAEEHFKRHRKNVQRGTVLVDACTASTLNLAHRSIEFSLPKTLHHPSVTDKYDKEHGE